MLLLILHFCMVASASALTATCNTTFSELQYSITNVVCPPDCIELELNTCTSFPNLNDPICPVAVAQGRLNESGGPITVYDTIYFSCEVVYRHTDQHQPVQPCNNVREKSYSFTMSCSTTGDAQNEHKVSCPAGCQGDTYPCGQNLFYANSSICAAGIETGKLTAAGGETTVKTFSGEDDANPCKPHPAFHVPGPTICEQNPGICQNGGTCSGNETSYTCNCFIWYSGNDCETIVLNHHVVTTPRNWNDSRAFCQSIDGDLVAVAIRHSATRRWIVNNLIRTLPVNNYWIGLTDIANEDVFVYVDGVVRTEENSNFYPGEPNGGLVENCVVMNGAADYEFDDSDCSFENPSVCERNGYIQLD